MRLCISLATDERGDSNRSEKQPSIFIPMQKLKEVR